MFSVRVLALGSEAGANNTVLLTRRGHNMHKRSIFTHFFSIISLKTETKVKYNEKKNCQYLIYTGTYKNSLILFHIEYLFI